MRGPPFSSRGSNGLFFSREMCYSDNKNPNWEEKVMIGFIGCGNMGGALAQAAAKALDPSYILLSNRTPQKAAELAAQLGAKASDNETIARTCGLIFLGVKPQMMGTLLSSLSPILAARTDRFVLVSMAAGLSIARIREMAGGDYPVIRMMPNTPVSIGKGVIQYCTQGVTPAEKEEFCRRMEPAGLLDELPEQLINAANCVSGCGVAFASLMMEALADGAVACGLPRNKANLYAAHTLQGMAALALESGEHFGLLKDRVCSPGGSTIQGVRALEQGGFRSAAMEAIIAAFEKTEQMGKS